MAAYPETEKHLNGLAEALLRCPSSPTPGERETIAAYVSAGNECRFCCQSHAAAGAGTSRGPTKPCRSGSRQCRIFADLAEDEGIAGHRHKAARDGRLCPARRYRTVAGAEGADDKAIHDTVLIAAAFCMFNRYVDGLGILVAGRSG